MTGGAAGIPTQQPSIDMSLLRWSTAFAVMTERSAAPLLALELDRGSFMAKNGLQELHDVGQSIWLDSIDRRMLHDGELDRRIREDALTGMTSNPTIFEKALSSSTAYDDQITDAEDQGLTSWQLFELLETTDVRDACDRFAGVYSSTRGADGFVSIEISPGGVLERALQILRDYIAAAMPRAIEIERLVEKIVARDAPEARSDTVRRAQLSSGGA